jgi:hypothetical protein
LLGRPKHRWEFNFKIDIKEGKTEDMDWINVAEERDKYLALVNTVVNMWLAQNAWNLLAR